ncbi:MAG: zinc-ribbon domain-containing protein [Zoogloeaceae bacterium]|jgi:ribosomal protein L40E|nr:zinc-ribbon domain-containing protein [Zoogloeaceae bacterium]
MFCKKCGNGLPETAKFCSKCGEAMPTGASGTTGASGATSAATAAAPPETPAIAPQTPARPCPVCSASLSQEAKFCPKCGYRFAPAPLVAEESAPRTYTAPPPVEVEPAVASPADAGFAAHAEPAASTAETPAASKNKQVMLIAGLCLILVTGIIGWFVFSKNPAEETTQEPAPAAAPAETAPVQPAADAASTPIEPLLIPQQTAPEAAAAKTQTKPAVVPNQPIASQKPRNAKPVVEDNAAASNTPPNTLPNMPPEPPPTIDQLYKARAASECASGISGVLCRESLRHTLCKGHWNENPPAGQSLCRQEAARF